MTQNLDTLKGIIEAAAEHANDLFNLHGSFEPFWLAVDKEGTPHIMITPWANEFEKSAVAAKLREVFKDLNIVRYVLASEVWCLNVTEGVKYSPGESLEHHPDRHEAVTYTAEDLQNNHIGAEQPILRPEMGKPTLAPIKWMDDFTEVSGRMVGLLQDPNKRWYVIANHGAGRARPVQAATPERAKEFVCALRGWPLTACEVIDVTDEPFFKSLLAGPLVGALKIVGDVVTIDNGIRPPDKGTVH